MTRIKLVKKTFFAANQVMILFVIFAALVEQCLASSLGSKCQHDMDCTDFIKGSTCSMNGYCECAPYYVQYNVTTCLSSQLLGGDCTLADQCTMKVANSSCLDGACRCVEGFLQFRKHTCLGPAHPGAVCYSHAHCQMNDKKSHCDFLIPNLFGRCQCTSPAKQYGGMCIVDDTSSEFDAVLSETTTHAPLITPPSTVFRPIDLISHYEITTQGKPLLVSNEDINLVSSTENQVGFTKVPEMSVSSSNEQSPNGEDFVDHMASSTEGIEQEVAHQEVTIDDYPYKIDNEETSINEEDFEQIEENEPIPVAPEEDIVNPPHDETQLNNEDLQSEQKPEEIDNSEHDSSIQSSSETAPNLEQLPEVDQQKPEDDIHLEQETATEVLTKIESLPQAVQENKDEEANEPENLSEVNKIEEIEDSPEKNELHESNNPAEQSASVPANSQESNISSEPEKPEESPIDQPSEEDKVQTTKPVEESTELPLSHEENLSGQENTPVLSEDESQSVQDLSEALNSESQENKNDKTETIYDSEKDSLEKEQENIAQQEESHYRPSSDAHGQEEIAPIAKEAEAPIKTNEDVSATINEEKVQEPLENVNGDESQNEPIKNEAETAQQVDLQKPSLDTEDNSVLQSEEAEAGHIEEEEEENVQEQTVEEQSIEKEDEVPQVESTGHFSEEAIETDHTPEEIHQESNSEQLIENEEKLETDEKKDAVQELLEESAQGHEDEKLGDDKPLEEHLNVEDNIPEENQQTISQEDINNSEINAEEEPTSSTEKQEIPIPEDHQQEPNKAIQETIEELLHEAVQALAEKDAQSQNEHQNQDEEQSLTEKPVSESEEKILQTLQEETAQFGNSDEIIYQPSKPSLENTQEDSTVQPIEQENYISSQQSESGEVQQTPIEEEVVPESITEALPEEESQNLVEENVTENSERDEAVEEAQNSLQSSSSEKEVPQSGAEGEKEEELAEESIENAMPVVNEEHVLVPKLDLSLPVVNSNENQLLESEETPNASHVKEEETKKTELQNESPNEIVPQVHDLENIIEGAEAPNLISNNNPLNSGERETPEANRGEETLTLDENPISSNENTISDSNEKTESDNTLGTHPNTKPIDEVQEIDANKEEDNNELLETEQVTSIHSESEQNSDHESPVHPTFETSGETQVIENVNDKTTTTDTEAEKETQSGANANESEHATTEYVPLVAVAESETTLSTPVAIVEPEFSETEKFEQFEDHHLSEEDKISEEATSSPALEVIEDNMENDLKASGDSSFNENESVLSILSGLLDNDEEGSGTPLPTISADDLKAEETVHSEQSPDKDSYYPSLLSDLLLSTKSENEAHNKPSTSGPLIEHATPEELPFDLSFVSPSDHDDLMSDNLVVETTPSINSGSIDEESQTTEVPDILEITTQTMLGLASRVTLMEPAAPVATTLKPFMDEDFSTTSSSLNMDSSITSKPVRKRVELGSGPVSLGLSCSSDRQCQLADPNTICSDQGICDCASKAEAKCSAERTGCSAGTFQCRSSGVCISWFFVCDGRPDCTDASDEECTFNARLNQTCPTESFRCEHSGRCISRAALCDGRKQCPHGEDELECDSLRTEGGHCPPNTFRCNSGECLPEYEYCNAIISCKDGSDEPPHLCGSRSVPNIFLRLLTAAVVDDTSARNSAGGINAYCPHRCSNGRCRSTAIVCSGRDGCGDGTDEQTCSVCRCPAPAYLAQQPSASMPLWK